MAKHCPGCDQDAPAATFAVERVLVAKPLGTWSLSGHSPKTVAQSRFQLSHTCGWSVIGRIEDDQFVVDPP